MTRNQPSSELTRSPDHPEPIREPRGLGRPAVWGLGLAMVVCVVTALTFYVVERLVRTGLDFAAAERRMGRVQSARDRLARLDSLGLGRPEVRLALGQCEAELAAPERALEVWERIPRGGAVWGEAAVARGWLLARSKGRFRAAEELFRDAASAGGRAATSARWALAELLTWQGRIDEVRGLLAEIWRTGRTVDRRAALRESWRLDSLVVAPDEFAPALDQAMRTAPDDDRVWLCRAWAERAGGQYDRAREWLKLCLEKDPTDQAVGLAWLEWAVAADSPQEAVGALAKLSPDALSAERAQRVAAWLARCRGDHEAEREGLLRLVEIVPGDVGVLDRLAVLSGGSAAQGYRRRRDEVARDQRAYRRLLIDDRDSITGDELALRAQLAQRLGRKFEARGWLTLVLEHDPNASSARHDLNALAAAARTRGPINLQAVARLTEEIKRWSSAPATPTPGSSEVVFRDRAREAGLDFTYENGASPTHPIPTTVGGGVAVLDYDRDGRLDVFVVQGGPFPPALGRSLSGDRLFRNRGSGAFDDATRSAGLAELDGGYGIAVTAADYDGDGWVDLFITRFGGYRLLRNVRGRFVDVTVAAGLGDPRGFPTSAAFADFDGDGDLDLFVCHYLEWDPDHPRLCPDPRNPGRYLSCTPASIPALPDHLFRNDQGRFTDVSEQAGVADRDGRGLGVVAADLDQDGRIDLFVANDMTANFLYLNQGAMRFKEVAQPAGVACNDQGRYQAGMGAACADADGDGLPDLAVTNFFGESTTFYRNLGAGLFTDATALAGLKDPSRLLLGFGVAWLDAQDDGRLDLVTANGHIHDVRPQAPYAMPVQLLIQDSRGRFVERSGAAGAPFLVPRIGRGLAVADLDNDGRLDFLVVSQNCPLAYFHNETPHPGRFLTLELEGAGQNRDAVGAWAAVACGETRRTSWRVGGGGYASSSDPRLHFGLGRCGAAATAQVHWPSGRVDRFAGLELDAAYRIREGDSSAARLWGRESGP